MTIKWQWPEASFVPKIISPHIVCAVAIEHFWLYDMMQCWGPSHSNCSSPAFPSLNNHVFETQATAPLCYWQRTSITAPMGQLLALLLPNTSFCFSSTEHIKGTHNIYLITATYPSVLEVSHTCKYSMFLESQEANQGYTHIQDTCVFCVSYTHLFTSQNKQLITQPQNTFFHLYCLLTNRMRPPVPPRL